MAEKETMSLQVGQKLWFVSYEGDGMPVTVVKVGYKWAELDNGNKAEMTSCKDGEIENEKPRYGGQYGDLFVNEAAHAEKMKQQDLRNVWESLRSRLIPMYFPPAHLSADAIREVALNLGIDLKGK